MNQLLNPSPELLHFIEVGLTISLFIMPILFIPQTRIIYIEKSGKGLSFTTLLLSAFVQFFGVLEVAVRGSWIHAGVYLIGIIGLLACICLKVYYDYIVKKDKEE